MCPFDVPHVPPRKLTKEEMERRNKETLLSTVGGKTQEAESQVKLLRQRISEMEDQMKKAEVAYKEQVRRRQPSLLPAAALLALPRVGVDCDLY